MANEYFYFYFFFRVKTQKHIIKKHWLSQPEKHQKSLEE